MRQLTRRRRGPIIGAVGDDESLLEKLQVGIGLVVFGIPLAALCLVGLAVGFPLKLAVRPLERTRLARRIGHTLAAFADPDRRSWPAVVLGL